MLRREEELRLCEHLHHLDLSHNEFQGVLPDAIKNMPSLAGQGGALDMISAFGRGNDGGYVSKRENWTDLEQMRLDM